jgi:hypothetical protein
MQLPWYKSKTAIISALVIGVLLVLKTYAFYVSTQEQKHTADRIVSLHALDPLYNKHITQNERSKPTKFTPTIIDKPIEKQARSILADTKASPKQRKLAQIYLQKYGENTL